LICVDILIFPVLPQSSPFEITSGQKSGVLKICYRHPQLNYFLTCWQ
jgi:hypothetical protein